MATAAQYHANRANAQQSTGPQTPAGIENSKHNATRHGLTGKQLVIKGEDPAQFDALRAALVEQHAPASELEAMLVEEIAQNWWRLQRAKKVESQVVDLYGLLECTVDPDARKAFQTISRYLTGIERAWRRASTELAALQKARLDSEAEAQPKTVPAKLGFVSQNPPVTPISKTTSANLISEPACDDRYHASQK